MTEPKTPASEDPSFPPIETRSRVLESVSVHDLIAWAKRFGVDATNREEAALAILRHEYGEEKFKQFSEWLAKTKAESERNREWARKTEAEVRAKDDALHHLSHVDLAAEAEAKVDARRKQVLELAKST